MLTSPERKLRLTTLIHFAGRAGDRNDRGIPGAERVAEALAVGTGLPIARVGSPAPPLNLDWRTELAAAMPDLERLRDAVDEALSRGSALLALNHCAASLATLPALARARPDACVVWFDAHGDVNTPAGSTTGFLGGLVLSGAAGLWSSGLGDGLDLGRVVLVGARDLDPPEQALVDEGRLRLVAPGPDLAARLMAAVGERLIYVHLDCDVLEPGVVPTEYQIPGGLSLADLNDAAAALATRDVIGLEIAEFEAIWPDGTPGETRPLVSALQPLLTKLRGDREV